MIDAKMNDIDTVEEIIFAPISDEDYAKRMRRIREAIKFQERKYRKVSRAVALHGFRHMFARENE